ncbi:insertion element IS2 transposase InsD [Serratia quinivorans]|nr:insertion element IS2 transposase InsD [Serratia quinivorans]
MSRTQLSIRVHRQSDWQDRRQHSSFDDTAVLSRINTAVADLPTCGYRRVWALLRRESEWDGQPVVNAKRVYRIMSTHHLLLELKPADNHRKRAHKGRVAVAESNRRWCSDGFEFRCDNREKLRVTFAQDCCDREIIDWAAGTGGYDKETVQDVMLGAVEKRFGQQLPSKPLEWLTDNGSAYRAHEMRAFARMLGLDPCTTAVHSPESNGIAESFVKTIKRDYISIMPKADSRSALVNLAIAFSHYNEHPPHSALGYRSPREYIRRKLSQP